MKRSALFLVTSDPLHSHRPAEAVRIAAGILPWQKIKVRIYFHHPFVRALQDHPEALIGLDLIQRFHPILNQQPHTALGPDHSAREFELSGSSLRLHPVTPTQLDTIRAASTWLLHF